MNSLQIVLAEISHRWRTSLVLVLIVSAITAGVTFFAIDTEAYQKEVSRNVRDLGSNIVIVPAAVDQVAYHHRGGLSDKTMPQTIVQQLLDERVSLNHLIPMLERSAEVQVLASDDRPSGPTLDKISEAGPAGGGTALGAVESSAETRIVGIAASIPLPGRPKAPMQKAIPSGEVQIGSALARQLAINRDAPGNLRVAGTLFKISRVNMSTGAWQDAALLMNLEDAQSLFDLVGKLSRIEALECTDEKCAATGKTSADVLEQELAEVTNDAVLLRRQSMADGRTRLRDTAAANSRLMQNMLWGLLALSVSGLALGNAISRLPEVGVLLSLGYGRGRIVGLFLGRLVLLSSFASVIGCLLGVGVTHYWSRSLLPVTGANFSIDWNTPLLVAGLVVLLSVLAGSLPVFWSAGRPPAQILGQER